MKPQQTLNIIFYTSTGLSLLAALLFETNMLIGGWWADYFRFVPSLWRSVWFVLGILTQAG